MDTFGSTNGTGTTVIATEPSVMSLVKGELQEMRKTLGLAIVNAFAKALLAERLAGYTTPEAMAHLDEAMAHLDEAIALEEKQANRVAVH
jgi:hypothetical protein